MKRPELSVVAAIAAHNSAESLEDLIPQLGNDNFQAIVLLDDGSTDNTPDIAKMFVDEIIYLRSSQNQGAVRNRNRVLEFGEDKYGAWLPKTIMYFLDGDSRHVSTNTPEKIRQALADLTVGYVGGLIRDPDGRQIAGNYAPKLSPRTLAAGFLHFRIDNYLRDRPLAEASARAIAGPFLDGFPNPLEIPSERAVFAAAEASLAIRGALFQRVGGYDPSFQHHEIQDLSMRLHQRGLSRWFDPGIAVTHQNYDLGSRKLKKDAQLAIWQFIKKFGLRSFLQTEPE